MDFRETGLEDVNRITWSRTGPVAASISFSRMTPLHGVSQLLNLQQWDGLRLCVQKLAPLITLAPLVTPDDSQHLIIL
jgi:hypothetical protein